MEAGTVALPRESESMKLAKGLANVLICFAVALFAVRIARPGPAAQQIPNVPAGITYNVKNFGAVCDGVTDDTAAIERTYNAAGVAMGRQGGAGVVYFPPSTGYCKVTMLHTPSMGYAQGWLVSVFDNGLFATTVYPGNNNAFVGRTSNFAGLGNSFLWGPAAEWQQPKGAMTPLVDMAGGNQIYFEGISFGVAGPEQQPIAIHMHDNHGSGVVNIVFKRCSVMGDFDVDASTPKTVAGFGLHIEDSSLGNLKFQNFGTITIRGSFLHSIRIRNTGIASNGNLEVDDSLSEALNNDDFLVVDTSGGPVTDILLRRVALADSIGKVYMARHINHTNANWVVNIKFEMIPGGNAGAGLIDPASAPDLFSAICEGDNCQHVLPQAQSTLYQFVGMPPKGPVIAWGSRYVPNPLVVTH
jgi:hypothetical protein